MMRTRIFAVIISLVMLALPALSADVIDFEGVSFTYSPSSPTDQDLITFTGVVKSNCNIAKSWYVRLYKDGAQIQAANVPTLNPGASHTVNFQPLTLSTGGPYSMKFHVEEAYDVADQNTANNHKTVSVTVGSAVPGISVSPTTLNFGTVTQGSSVAPKTFDITNTGGATLNVTSIASDRTWATVTPTVATILAGQKQMITVNVNPDQAPTGAQSAGISISSNAGNSNVAVSATVNPAPVIDFSAVSLSFSPASPSDNDAVTFTGAIKNEGNTAKSWYVRLYDGADYNSSANKSAMATPTIQPGSSYNATFQQMTLPAANYTFTFYIEHSYDVPDGNTANNSTTKSVTVSQSPPILAMTPTSLDFGDVEIGAAATSKTVTIQNTGGQSLDGTLSTTINWVTLPTPATFNVSSGQSKIVTIGIDSSKLAIGANGSNITVGTNGGNSSIAVSATGKEPPVISLSRTSIDFGELSQNKSYDQTFDVSNSGDGTLNVTNISSNSSWLTVSPTSASGLTSGQSKTFTVTVASGSDAGPKSGSLSISSNGGNATVSVSATVGQGAGDLTATPSSLDFGSVVQGDDAGSKSFAISNSTGQGTLSGSVSSDKSWVTVSPSSFSSNSQTFTVTIDTKKASFGNQTFTITLQSNAANGDQKVQGKIDILEPPPVLSVVTTSLDFGQVQSSKKIEKDLEIKNAGGRQLSGKIAVNAADQDWISVPVATFTGISGGQTAKYKVAVDGTKKDPGENGNKYTGKLIVTSDDPNEKPVEVTISAEIIPIFEVWNLSLKLSSVELVADKKKIEVVNGIGTIDIGGAEPREKIILKGTVNVTATNQMSDASQSVSMGATWHDQRNQIERISEMVPKGAKSFRYQLSRDVPGNQNGDYWLVFVLGALESAKEALGFDASVDNGGPAGGPVGNGNDIWDVPRNGLESAINNNYINHQLNATGSNISWPAAAVHIKVRGAALPPEPIRPAGEVKFQKLTINQKDAPISPPIEKELTIGEKISLSGAAVAQAVSNEVAAVGPGVELAPGDMAVIAVSDKKNSVVTDRIPRGGIKNIAINEQFTLTKNPATLNRHYFGYIAIPAMYLPELQNRYLSTPEWERLITVGEITVPLSSIGGRSLIVRGCAAKLIAVEPPLVSTDMTNIDIDEESVKETVLRKTIQIENIGGGELRGNVTVSQPRWMEVEPSTFWANKTTAQLNVMLKGMPRPDEDGMTRGMVVIETNGGKCVVLVAVKRRETQKVELALVGDPGLQPSFAFEGSATRKYKLIFRSTPGDIWSVDELLTGQTVTYNSDGTGLPLIPGVDIDYVVINKADGSEVLKGSFRIAEGTVAMGWAP